MKKFNFVEPKKIEIEKYPDIKSVYLNEGDDDEGYKDFFSYKDGVEIEDELTQSWVNEAVDYLLENPEEHYTYRMSGNTLVIATKNLDEINVFVSKNHMEAYVPLYD